MTRKDEELFKENNVCQFCDTEIFLNKFRDHCRLTGKNRGSAHNKCIFAVAQQKSNFFPFVFHKFRSSECHLSLKISGDMKENKVKFDNSPNTIGEYISATYPCFSFIVGYKIFSTSLGSQLKHLLLLITKRLRF